MTVGHVVAVDALCPLCGRAILSVGRSGRVEAHGVHLVPLYRRSQGLEGYSICEECSLLAQLPVHATLN